ncbi:MAG: serine hydrolase domain-containing protein [Candidatus Acidiferrum sp.]
MRWIILCLATLLVAANSLSAPEHPVVIRLDGSTIPAAEVDQTVTRLMKAGDVAGVTIAILNGGKISYVKAYGLRDKDKNLPLTVNSVMSAGSFSNVVFAYMVMQVVAEGVLNLDKPIYKYLPKPLPEYPDYADLADDPRWKHITPRMLLSQTSGFADWRTSESDRKLKIHFKPGTRFAYSSEGIDLLQLVVETVTQTHLEELMQEHVFDPLGMTRTSMVWNREFENDYANGYGEDGRSLGPRRRSIALAAESMQTTISDLALFVQAVMEEKLLRNKVREQMLSPQIPIISKHEYPTLAEDTAEENKTIHLSYGLGWGLYSTSYGRAFFKDGRDGGWSNYTVCFDQPKTAVVILTNSAHGPAIFKGILDNLLKDPSAPVEWEGFGVSDKLSVARPSD